MTKSRPDGEVHSENYAFEFLYPFPIADLFRRYRISRNPYDQLGYLFATSEASLKLMVGVAYSLGTDDVGKICSDFLPRLGAPSFGTWLELFRTLLGECSQAHALTESLLNSSSRKRVGGFLQSIEAIIPLRNSYVHKDGMTSSAAESTIDQVGKLVRQTMRSFSFISRSRLVICEEMRRIRNPSCFEGVFRVCHGCNPLFRYEVLRLETPIDPGIPYLISPADNLAFALHPFVAASNASSYGIEFLYSVKKTPTWHAMHQGSQVTTPDQSLKDEVMGIFAGESARRSYEVNLLNATTPSVFGHSEATDNHIYLPDGYEVLGIVGEGRYGRVYKILHRELEQVRALKIMKTETADDPRMRRRVSVEAKALARLQGLGVATEIFEYGESKHGLPYIVLEYAEQGSLHEAMLRWGKRDWNDVLAISLSCFKSLARIHKAGIIHRDIKLANILVQGDQLLFCDFGVVRLTDRDYQLTEEGDAIGTLAFMAPEQHEGNSDEQSDIYSLGFSMVCLIAGELVADAHRWLYERYDGNDELRKILLSLTEPIPQNRPMSAEGVVQRLAQLSNRLGNEEPNDEEEAIAAGNLKPVHAKSRRVTSSWVSADGTEFQEIEAGLFLMGATKYGDERPVHKVEISSPFFMSRTLVTNRQFQEFIRATSYRSVDSRFILHIKRNTFDSRWRLPNSPVVFISWTDAKEYALWRSEKENLDFRLPTEAQWEYACRANTRTVYPWGNEFSLGMANIDNQHSCPTPVGSYPPNTWGLLDMIGNVWEWCEDVKDVIPREESIFYRSCAEQGVVKDPVNSDPAPIRSQRVQSGLRVIRGGSFSSEGRNCRPANRRGESEGKCGRAIGFRLVLADAPEEIETRKSEGS